MVCRHCFFSLFCKLTKKKKVKAKKSGTLNGLVTRRIRRAEVKRSAHAVLQVQHYLRTFKTYSTFIDECMEGKVWQIKTGKEREIERKYGKKKMEIFGSGEIKKEENKRKEKGAEEVSVE